MSAPTPPGRVPVVMGQPVDLADLSEAGRQAYAEAARERGVQPFVYDDHEETVCTGCAMRIRLGPRSVAIRNADPRTVVLCIECVARQMNAAQAPVLAQSLGNTKGHVQELPGWLRAYPATGADGGGR